MRWTEVPWSTLCTHTWPLHSPNTEMGTYQADFVLWNMRGPCSTYAMHQHRSSAHLWQKHLLTRISHTPRRQNDLLASLINSCVLISPMEGVYKQKSNLSQYSSTIRGVPVGKLNVMSATRYVYHILFIFLVPSDRIHCLFGGVGDQAWPDCCWEVTV